MTTCTKKLNGEFRPIKYSQADRGAEGITLFAFEASYCIVTQSPRLIRLVA